MCVSTNYKLHRWNNDAISNCSGTRYNRKIVCVKLKAHISVFEEYK